jgi:hypothetical protein
LQVDDANRIGTLALEFNVLEWRIALLRDLVAFITADHHVGDRRVADRGRQHHCGDAEQAGTRPARPRSINRATASAIASAPGAGKQAPARLQRAARR